MKKRLLASFLSLVLILGLLPTAALAAGTGDDGLCPHHTEHTAECGYAAPTEGTPCTHVHAAECYSDGSLPADDEEKEADACAHVHDTACGYSEGSEGSPCTFVCSICPVEAMIEALPTYADATPEDVADIEAAQAAYDALTAEEQAAVDTDLAEKLADLSELAGLLADAQDSTDDAVTLNKDGSLTDIDGTAWRVIVEDSKIAMTPNGNTNAVITATLNGDTLTISGNGPMPNLNKSTEGESISDGAGTYPWASWKDKVTSIVISDDITSVGAKSFIGWSNVTSVSIGKDVQTIGTAAFAQMPKCETFTIDKDNTAFMVEDGVVYNAGKTTLYYYLATNTAETFEVPGTVTTIGYNAFCGATNLKTVTIPDDSLLEAVGYGSFANTSSLESIGTFPKTVTAVGEYAFSGSSVLNICCVAESVVNIFSGQFEAGDVIKIYTPDESASVKATISGYEYLLNAPHDGQAILVSAPKNAENVEVPETVTDEEEVYTVTTIGYGAFAVSTDYTTAASSEGQRNTALKTVTLPKTITEIGERAFYFCTSLKTVTFAEGTGDVALAPVAFYTYSTNYGSTGITIDFSGVTGSVTGDDLPNYIVKIIVRDEKQLNALKTLCAEGTEASVEDDPYYYWTKADSDWEKQYVLQTGLTYTDGNSIKWTFSTTGEDATLTAYDKKTEQNVTVPSTVSHDGIDYTVTTIGDGLFGWTGGWDETANHNTNIVSVVLPETVRTIGPDAFRYSTSLKYVTFKGNSITFKDGCTFSGCSSLEAIDLSAAKTITFTDGNETSYFANIQNGTIIYVSSTEIQETVSSCVPEDRTIIYAITNGGFLLDGVDSTVPESPIKEKQVFTGWYSDDDYTEDNQVNSFKGSDENTYYAGWKGSEYKVPETLDFGTVAYDYAPITGKTLTITTPENGSITSVTDSEPFNATLLENTVTVTPNTGLAVGSYSETITVWTGDGSFHNVTVSLSVSKADSEVTPVEGSATITATYGDTITLTAAVAKAATNSIALTAEQDMVDFYCGGILLGSAEVTYNNDEYTEGTATLTYDTSNGGIPAGTTSTITAVYGGSVTLNGSNTNSIKVTLNKINTSIDITPDRTSLTGGGTMTLTVDKSGLPAGADVKVTCNNGVTPTENTDGTWAATLPNATATYTFSATYEGNAYYSGATDTCTVSVTRRSNGGGGSGGSTTYTVSTDAGRNGDVTVSPSRASYGDTVTITVDPDEGYELDELIVTDSDGDEISVRSRGDGRYTFTMPRGRVTVKATFVEITEDPDLLTFTDVPASAYYYDAVYWAVENGVTNGTSNTTFSPDASCTRAQMVTFLWRAAGSPEPESTVNPFTDVSASAYYYDAVLWAVEQGITNGTSATTFGPDATVTRGQTVTFLWRYDGSTAVSGSGFADVASDAYYADAVAWAAGEGVTSGTSATTFSPSNDCTRGQIVTFLYRYMA